MNLKPLIAAAVLAATCSAPAWAITFEGSLTQGGTVVTDYASTGLVSFDVDFANAAPATVEYRIDDDDLNMPIDLNAIFRNFTASGFDGYTMLLSKGSFASIGTVTRQFGGSTDIAAAGGLATLSFSPPEYLDVEVGNALGSTSGALDWTLGGLQSGDRLSITVSVVPEPGTWALMWAGLASLCFMARRRRA